MFPVGSLPPSRSPGHLGQIVAGVYGLAYSNIFGSNAFDVALLLPAALVYPGVLFEAPPHAIIYAAALGTLMTSILIWGLLEKKDRAILRMGWDSLSVLALCLLDVIELYFPRQGPLSFLC